jgi:transcriptional regulator with XRE-family HTH domain
MSTRTLPRWYFGEFLNKALSRKGWNASELAKRSGLSHVYVGQIIRGCNPDTGKPPQISVKTMKQLADALDLQPLALIQAYEAPIDYNQAAIASEKQRLRDQFAGQALAGLLADPTRRATSREYAKCAYEIADAMLEAREGQ